MTLNGSLKLSGKDNKSNTEYIKTYHNFDINTVYKSQNSTSSFNTTFDSEDLYLDLIGEFEIKDDSLNGPKIISNLDEIQLLINKDNKGDYPKFDFRFKIQIRIMKVSGLMTN